MYRAAPALLIALVIPLLCACGSTSAPPRTSPTITTGVVAGRSVTLPAGGGPGLTPGVRVRVRGTVNGPGIIALTLDIL